jgi:hypothetical protein
LGISGPDNVDLVWEILQTWCLGSVRTQLGVPVRLHAGELSSEHLQILTKQHMSERGINILAVVLKSRPDMLIFESESGGGHEKVRESQENQNPGK